MCNGCTDSTPFIAKSHSRVIRVLELSHASKYEAMRAGDAAATGEILVFVDADVVITRDGIAALVRPIQQGLALASGPVRIVPRDGVSFIVDWYYDVWERLPQVRSGLFGRGVIALSADGCQRVRTLPLTISDDLAISELFSESERVVVEGAQVTIYPPRTIADLIRRRTRSATGNSQADAFGLRSRNARTSIGTVFAAVGIAPSAMPKVMVFIGLAVVSRIRSFIVRAKGTQSTWLRDESSRSAY